MKGAAATAGMLSAALLVFSPPAPALAQRSAARAATLDPATLAGAELFVEMVLDERYKGEMIVWLRDNFPGDVRDTIRSQVGLEQRYPGITDYMIGEVQATALRNFDQTYRSIKREIALSIAGGRNSGYLRRIATFLRSPMGRRYTNIRRGIAVGQDGHSAVAAFIRTMSAQEATDLIAAFPDDESWAQLAADFSSEYQRLMHVYLQGLFYTMGRTDDALISSFRQRRSAG